MRTIPGEADLHAAMRADGAVHAGSFTTKAAQDFAHVRKLKALQAICALAVIATGAVTLAEYTWGLNAHIDQFLFHDSVQFQFPGRMAPISAANFLLTGAMLYPWRFRVQKSRTAWRCWFVLALRSPLLAMLYGVPLLYGSAVTRPWRSIPALPFWCCLWVFCISRKSTASFGSFRHRLPAESWRADWCFRRSYSDRGGWRYLTVTISASSD